MGAPSDTDRFRYGPFDLDLDAGSLECHYEVGGRSFVERVTVPLPPDGKGPDPAALGAAARLVHLLAGVSYYKTAAPAVVDLGDHATTELERRFLLRFYRLGLAEFAFRNGLDLSGLALVGPDREPEAPRPAPLDSGRPLVPFGGGIDSIVTAELVRGRATDPALFVVERPGEPFEAIEAAAAVSGLPLLRAQRLIDDQLLRSAELGFLQGHVPVTGIVSAVAVLTALWHGRQAVVMSNEHSASSPNLVHAGQPVNHQWSKSLEFEDGFREVVHESLRPDLDYFSLLRPYSELWVARNFAAMPEYHGTFRSCNRSFRQDRTARLDRWCAECDKCSFIDLVLAPFLAPDELEVIFDGREPLANPALAEQFRALLGRSERAKPFECVGDVAECRAAMAAVAGRPDRVGYAMVQELAAEIGGARPGVAAEFLQAHGPHHIPEAYAPERLLV